MPPSPRGVATASIAGVDEAFVGRLFAAFRSLDAAAAAAVLSSIATTSNKTCKEGPNSSSVAFSSDVDDRLEHALLEAAARGDAQGAVRCVARRFVYLASTATPTADCAAKPKLKSQRKQPRPPPLWARCVLSRRCGPVGDAPRSLWRAKGSSKGAVGHNRTPRGALQQTRCGLWGESEDGAEEGTAKSRRRRLREQQVGADDSAPPRGWVSLRCCSVCSSVHTFFSATERSGGANANDDNNSSSRSIDFFSGVGAWDASEAHLLLESHNVVGGGAGASSFFPEEAEAGAAEESTEGAAAALPYWYTPLPQELSMGLHALCMIAAVPSKERRAAHASSQLLAAALNGDVASVYAYATFFGADVEHYSTSTSRIRRDDGSTNSNGGGSHRAVHMAAMIPDGSTAVAMLRLLAEGWSAEKSAAFKAPQYCCCGSGGLHTAAGVGGREPIGLHRGRRDASSRE